MKYISVFYSFLSARIGSMRAARRAGKMDAAPGDEGERRNRNLLFPQSMGLAFVSGVAMAHGGGVVARNQGLNGSPNGGAQIVVEFPLASILQD